MLWKIKKKNVLVHAKDAKMDLVRNVHVRSVLVKTVVVNDDNEADLGNLS